jgi:hypothetical protein
MGHVFVVYVLPGLAVTAGSTLVRSMHLDPQMTKQIVTGMIVAGLVWVFVAAFRVK